MSRAGGAAAGPGDGIVVEVHVHPGARRAVVAPHPTGGLRVAVTAPAVDGRANDAVVALLATTFGVRRRDVEVLTGHTARRKRVRIHGVGPEVLDTVRGAS